MKTVLIISAIVLLNVAVAAVFFLLKRKKGENKNVAKPSDGERTEGGTITQEPTEKPNTGQKKPVAVSEMAITPLYEVGDKISCGEFTSVIIRLVPTGYLLDGSPVIYVPFSEQEQWALVSDVPVTPPEATDTHYMDYTLFEQLVAEVKDVANIGEATSAYLKMCYDECYAQYYWMESLFGLPLLWNEASFPMLTLHYDFKQNTETFTRISRWVTALALTEIVPDKRDELYSYAYGDDKSKPLYCDDELILCRLFASVVYSALRIQRTVDLCRAEVGGKELTYRTDASEVYINVAKFLPSAPAPYCNGYEIRKEYPVGNEETSDIDRQIHEYVCKTYTLDSRNDLERQTTIQAIANKEYKKPHLFGKPRTVCDEKYGKMTFNPVFGIDSIGVEIPDDGAIADLVYQVGKDASGTRKSLLDAQYGRRRPGEGEKDGTANADPKQRVLVNYAIEEGDGHTTGYYNQGGDYVDGNGRHIGDYVTFYQNAVYANSYPSGHSAYIMAVTMLLCEVMPDRADKILRAGMEFAISRILTHYHWMSDTLIGRIIGAMYVPVAHATTNYALADKVEKAKDEYQRIINGEPEPSPTPTPPQEKVNLSLAYSIGGYGSCHVDAGEASMTHYCNKECYKDRNPSITVNQRVNFTIEGDSGMTTIDGKTSGTFEANVAYVMVCPKVDEGEEKVATITLRNDNGKRILYYTLSRRGTHDDGCNNY